ncbi:SprT-like domain-containing protein [Acinetobacter pittii]|uniref:SprT-like domain-containing protein n=1 Tax=Acinetobacter pittii TaxID=48296 RepID=UPI002AFE9AB8|nr:SprT-like domain-containing protein [Acinetobacter pittii]
MNSAEELKKQLISLGMLFRNQYAEWPKYVILGQRGRNLIEQYNLSVMLPSEFAAGKSALPGQINGFTILESLEREYFAVANHLMNEKQFKTVTKLELEGNDLFGGQNKKTYLGIPIEKVATTKGDLYGIVLHNTECNPTLEAYGELNLAYDFFNKKLFDGQLPKCLITLQREKRTAGYFCKGQFVNNSGEEMDEIAMNPAYFGVSSISETLATLVHECCHAWQCHFGRPTRNGYHNTEFSEKLESLGLMPSNTGLPGGKKVGQAMNHYIIEGGPFEKACLELLSTEFKLSWYDKFPPYTEAQLTEINEIKSSVQPKSLQRFEDGINTSVLSFAEPKTAYSDDDLNQSEGEEIKPVNKSNRLKYRCPTCKAQVWGKPDIKILCGEENCKTVAYEIVE